MRFGILQNRRVVSFDTHDRENDDGGGLSRRVNATEAHDTPFVGEFDNAAHLGGPAVVRGLLASDPLAEAIRNGVCDE